MDQLHLRRLLMIVIALAPIAVFAACGSSSSKNATSTASTGGGTPAAGGATNQNLGTVSVLGIWGDTELESFRAMVAPWGGNMDFTGSRSITALLTTRVEGGNPPDVAIPAEIGLFQQFAKEGKLKPLSDCPGLEDKVKSNYPQQFLDLGTVDGKLYGFFMKADTKATIFYNPQFFQQHNLKPLTNDSSFDDLIALSDQIKSAGVPPWSMGQEAGDGSGFPGSDTIQQIVLNQEGKDFYDGVVSGSQKFTDDKMKDAWQKYAQLALTSGYTVQGSGAAINATNFHDSAYPPFQSPPTAGLVHLGAFASGFITTQFPNAKPGTDFDFMPWPGGAVTGGANIVYAFKTNPTVCSFLDHIAGADSQAIWVKRGGFTSLNKTLDLNTYPDPVAKKAAQQLLDAKTFRFDLDDAIGGAVQQAEFQGVIQFLNNKNQLDSILSGVQSSRQ